MIITICGSLKFQQEMISLAQKMTFLGHCVITPIFQTSKNPNYTEEQIQKLKNAHLKKIDISDELRKKIIDLAIKKHNSAVDDFISQKQHNL